MWTSDAPASNASCADSISSDVVIGTAGLSRLRGTDPVIATAMTTGRIVRSCFACPAFAGYPAARASYAGQGVMGNLKVYGVAASRAYRTLWMVNELGLEYEHVPVHFGDGSAKTAEYLAINPNGR